MCVKLLYSISSLLMTPSKDTSLLFEEILFKILLMYHILNGCCSSLISIFISIFVSIYSLILVYDTISVMRYPKICPIYLRMSLLLKEKKSEWVHLLKTQYSLIIARVRLCLAFWCRAIRVRLGTRWSRVRFLLPTFFSSFKSYLSRQRFLFKYLTIT